MQVEGRERLIRKLRAARTGGRGGAERGARLAGEALISDSVPVTPKQEGTLRSTANMAPVTGVFRTQGGFYVVVGYDTEYARAVHEMPPDTNWTTPGTGPKYLTGPFERNREEYLKIMAESVRKGLVGG